MPARKQKTVAIAVTPCLGCAHAAPPEDPRMDGFLRCKQRQGLYVSTTFPRQCLRFEAAGR